MKFKQYLIESSNPSVEEVLQMIYTDCMPFVKDVSNLYIGENLLYSGRKGFDSVIKKSVRTDRKPKDSLPSVHKVFDELFYKKFGLKGRSSALFCTGDYNEAAGYGNTVYIIFPIDKYKILWSYRIFDMYNSPDVNSIYLQYGYSLKDNIEISHSDKLKDDLMHDIISTYTTKDLSRAIKSKHEIMLFCKEYYGFKNSYYNFQISSYIYRYGTKFPTKERFKEWYDEFYKEDCKFANNSIQIFKDKE